ncbi:hypothetical protein DXC62_04480 [Ruminococcaceae bacterium TF06-43]|nr:hypothetical protein DXC62_04480 [Ruminococcaceae bacterium TF06-43]
MRGSRFCETAAQRARRSARRRDTSGSKAPRRRARSRAGQSRTPDRAPSPRTPPWPKAAAA